MVCSLVLLSTYRLDYCSIIMVLTCSVLCAIFYWFNDQWLALRVYTSSVVVAIVVSIVTVIAVFPQFTEQHARTFKASRSNC